MDYFFENLGFERFQEFCQCIVNKEFDNVLSFPIGQPDGGRDAISYFTTSTKKDYIVFQVKFVKNANLIIDPHKWIVETLSGEVNKIAKLVPQGAKAYYLLTNVKGTGHFQNGSLDILNQILEDNIEIPSICWWRDDLCRKLESNPELKWSFPEILSGHDILISTLLKSLSHDNDKLNNIVRAYLADQYERDNQVKFKQIDLHNYLLDLFTDVPIRVKKINIQDKKLKEALENFEKLQPRRIDRIKESLFFDERESIGAAEFILNSFVQENVTKILIEGGPGQGKSTIAQYVCQVHRAHLLNKTEALEKIPPKYQSASLRLPIKIDLRHIALWVENKNPYKGVLSDEYFNSIWQKSLESFLVFHICYHSQINEINTNDLISIFKFSKVLIVFDGFDEIANLDVRKDVIEFINKGLNRLTENSNSLQIIITSRPAAFSDTVGFSIDLYPHFELTDITPKITAEYLEKWIIASKLDQRESEDIRRLVSLKLELPHLKDLAKSPMQLAIFISLLRTKGEALPNKRTALYDNYISLFFDRETEKNAIILNNRDLIISIHQYLAWILHSEAELNKTSGMIQIDQLKILLYNYLSDLGHQTNITDELFNVVKERVCALVSRVQGTFEFEVQPLREYFCAKFLFSTSPYSPPGAEKPGTKPKRFDAISRNFYWQNVLRFFCGCFDVGELPLLTEKLYEMIEDELFKNTNYPYIISSQLLSDFVFSQSPRNQNAVIQIIIEGIQKGIIVDQSKRWSESDQISLPFESGRAEIFNQCFSMLKQFPKRDFASELINLIIKNPVNIIKNWIEYSYTLSGQKLTLWLEYGLQLRLFPKLENKYLEDIIISEENESVNRIQILINGNRSDILNANFKIKKLVVEETLRNNLFWSNFKASGESLNFLGIVLNPFIYSRIFDIEQINYTFDNYITRLFDRYTRENSKAYKDFQVVDELDEKILAFSLKISSVLNKDVMYWKSHLEPWDLLIESCREYFGDSWRINILSVIAAGIKFKNAKISDFTALDESDLTLCERVRYARMKSGNTKYWSIQFAENENKLLTALIFFTWATPKTIIELIDIMTPILDSFHSDQFVMLAEGVIDASQNSKFTAGQIRSLLAKINNDSSSNRLLYLLSCRMKFEDRIKFTIDHIKYSEEIKDKFLSFKLRVLVTDFLKGRFDLLKEIKNIYSLYDLDFDFDRYFYREIENEDLPNTISRKIMEDPLNYPRFIVNIAEKNLSVLINKHVIPVGEIARKEKWFNID